jgi:hypothetical protein
MWVHEMAPPAMINLECHESTQRANHHTGFAPAAQRRTLTRKGADPRSSQPQVMCEQRRQSSR